MTPQPAKGPKLFEDYWDEANDESKARYGESVPPFVQNLAIWRMLDDLAQEVHGLRGEVERLKGVEGRKKSTTGQGEIAEAQAENYRCLTCNLSWDAPDCPRCDF